MPIQVRIPVQLRALTGGQEVVTASGNSVLQLIEDIDQQISRCQRPHLRSRRQGQAVR